MVKENLHTTQLDEEAFETLFRSYFTFMCSFAHKFIPDMDVAKDIVHEVFTGLWEKRMEIDTSKPVKSYLFTAVNNKCLNYIRDHKKFDNAQEMGEVFANRYADEQNTLIEGEMKHTIQKTLDSLPEKCREVFELSRYEGLTYNEIAERLGISVKTVENQMGKALKIFRESLKEYLTLLLLMLLNGMN